ncbi:RidA family protein [Streptomyces marokkonensis]|uniref:RidA family protein n=1 Tax=Streptomyces marokkonensis TaxID=324855 RepID=A0ABW6QGB3_9ACTN
MRPTAHRARRHPDAGDNWHLAIDRRLPGSRGAPQPFPFDVEVPADWSCDRRPPAAFLRGAGHAGGSEKNIDLALAAAGTSRDHLVKETIYVVDYRSELVTTLLGPLRSNRGKPPASTLIGVQSMVLPDCLVEVDVIAHVPPA